VGLNGFEFRVSTFLGLTDSDLGIRVSIEDKEEKK